MVSTRAQSSKSSRPFNNLLVTMPKAPITIGIIVTFMFHSFFNYLARLRYLFFFSHSFSFILWTAGTAKSTILQIFFFFFFLLILIRSGLLAEIRWSVFISVTLLSLFIYLVRVFKPIITRVLNCSPSDSKFPLLSRSLLSILVNLNPSSDFQFSKSLDQIFW